MCWYRIQTFIDFFNLCLYRLIIYMGKKANFSANKNMRKEVRGQRGLGGSIKYGQCPNFSCASLSGLGHLSFLVSRHF